MAANGTSGHAGVERDAVLAGEAVAVRAGIVRQCDENELGTARFDALVVGPGDGLVTHGCVRGE